MSAFQRPLIEFPQPAGDIQFDPETNERLTGWHKSHDRTVDLYAEGKFSRGFQRALVDLIEQETYGRGTAVRNSPGLSCQSVSWQIDLTRVGKP
jgi:hypothetical protein